MRWWRMRIKDDEREKLWNESEQVAKEAAEAIRAHRQTVRELQREYGTNGIEGVEDGRRTFIN